MKIPPVLGLTTPRRSLSNVLFPIPESPEITTKSFLSIVKLQSSKIASSSSYLKETCSKTSLSKSVIIQLALEQYLQKGGVVGEQKK